MGLARDRQDLAELILTAVINPQNPKLAMDWLNRLLAEAHTVGWFQGAQRKSPIRDGGILAYTLRRTVGSAPIDIGARKIQQEGVNWDLAKVPASLYQGLERQGDALVPVFKDVMVSRFFLPRLSAMNYERQRRDLGDADLHDRINRWKGRVLAGRYFPPTLRRLIHDRDQFTCQECGEHRIQIIARGASLQVDHRIAWIDGGETTYSNGRTVCSTCNVAKHHAKDMMYR